MKRLGILTAGGDTPALNATIHGAVERANQLRIEMYGFLSGFQSLLQPDMAHVVLNPLFMTIPELDPTRGGTIIGASRDYISEDDTAAADAVADRLRRMGIDGVICVGGDGTLNGLQPLADRFRVILAPKTIDNDLGLNYRNEPDEWLRETRADGSHHYRRTQSRERFSLDNMVNYATPGYATSVFVAASGVQRVRTTAESHRRVAIIEVMGRDSGYIAIGAAYGQPDIVLVPESVLDLDKLVERIREIYELQRNVVILCGEGIVGADGAPLGAEHASTDPAGNIILSGAAEALRRILKQRLKDAMPNLTSVTPLESAIFTRKVGHTQRGGRPIFFDRFYASQLGGRAVDMLVDGQNNAVATLQWSTSRGFFVDSFPANGFRDRWGHIHARQMHPSFYDAERLQLSETGIEYLLPIFNAALGHDDVEALRQTVFDSGNLTRSFHSVNIDVLKRVRRLRPSN